MSDTAKGTEPNSQGDGTQDDANKNKPNKPEDKSGTQTGNDKSDKSEDKKTEEKTFTQAQVNALLAKERRDLEQKAKDAEERAKMSEEERTKAELDSLKRENQMIKAESEVTKLLKDAGAKSPELLFSASKGDLEFKDGKLTNGKELLEDLKSRFPEQFGEDKPKEGIDAGAGSNKEEKGRADSLGDALKNHYKKK